MVQFGIDLGSKQCVVGKHDGDVVLNELGGMTTSTLVAFKNNERFIGEPAVAISFGNSIKLFPALVGKTLDQVNERFDQLPIAMAPLQQDGSLKVTVQYDGQDTTFTMEHIGAMLFNKLKKCTQEYLVEGEEASFVVAVPSHWSEGELNCLRRAGAIADMKVAFTSVEKALARCFQVKHPNAADELKYIMIVDMGYLNTTVAIVSQDDKECIVYSECDAHLGCRNFDVQMYQHFVAYLAKEHKVDICESVKKQVRLLAGCERLKTLLSTASTTQSCSIQVENLGNDCDITLTMSREKLEGLCEVDAQRLNNLLDRVLENGKIKVDDIESVEIVGGGTRIPFVQNCIVQKVHDKIGRRLDGTTAVALGAAYTNVDEEKVEDVANFALERKLEQKMMAKDAELFAISELKNAIEAYIYDMRDRTRGKFGDKIDTSALYPILDRNEEWIYSEEADAANSEKVSLKFDEMKTEIQSACSAYFDALNNEQQSLESELDAESKQAEQEKIDNPDDDHDTRKLKKPERMRLVVKNKEEGSELLRDGNYKPAAARYVKALTHASKFFDLSSQDKDEVNKLKLSLYLNLAQCYLKMENFHKVVLQCNDALDLDASNIKAYYRRAFAYEKQRKFDQANSDIQRALKLSSNDKAIVNLSNRIQHQIKKQLSKEKKMWGKAFS